ncbi:hypothetical protein DN069_03640 [Streptacidiphilus pinicola]|uniref:DUF3592 domain-containing protein n=1 Tax=Streptacidiphilus pinicola TaxID=2219663 RepID=A0A2X0JHA2_9ACTN|nr:DUF3592 domain-containing protein [Streptacidiphilus pinicola]RAG87058.1 hypothetical protein DN069_03640 [Streptacidiphilus pinicola]
MGGTGGIVTAVFLGIGGLAAYLAGVSGLVEARRIRRDGHRVRALVRTRPGATRPLLQFTTEDDRELVMEVYGPAGLPEGQEVWLRYDPADPREILVEGHEGRGRERAFVALGVTAVLAALAVLATT